MQRDEVDIGVGVMQAGPYGCPACHYVEGEIDDAAEPTDADKGRP